MPFQQLCIEYSEHVQLAHTVREARDIVSRGKIAVFWHTEALLLANDLAVLRAYHALGMRATGLVHAAPQEWINSDKEQHIPPGLTEFGKSVIRNERPRHRHRHLPRLG